MGVAAGVLQAEPAAAGPGGREPGAGGRGALRVRGPALPLHRTRLRLLRGQVRAPPLGPSLPLPSFTAPSAPSAPAHTASLLATSKSAASVCPFILAVRRPSGIRSVLRCHSRSALSICWPELQGSFPFHTLSAILSVILNRFSLYLRLRRSDSCHFFLVFMLLR